MADMLRNDPLFVYVVAPAFIFWLGCCIGSFLNVCIWRIPRGESIAHPPSHCPTCNYAIPFWLNVPILSWCMLKGRCRSCKAPIAVRYVVVEFITGVLFLITWAVVVRHGVIFELLPGWLTLITLLFCCSVIDWEQQIIPNKLTRFGVVTGLIFSTAFPIMQGVGVLEGKFFPLQNARLMPILKNFCIEYHFDIHLYSWLEGVLASLLGILVGYFLIAIFIELGKLFFGREKHSVKEGIDFVFKDGMLTFGENEVCLDYVLSRKNDRVIVTLSESSAGAGVLAIYESRIVLNGDDLVINELPTDMKVTGWIIPREVMGYGDAKLLAVCGAFMGPEGAILSLCIGSLLACSLVFPYVILKRNKKIGYIPFGGYIAGGAFFLLVVSAYLL